MNGIVDQVPSHYDLSFSRIRTFEDSPLKYKLRYIDGIKEKPSKAMLFGRNLHSLLLEKKEFEVIPEQNQGHISTVAELTEEIKRLGLTPPKGKKEDLENLLLTYNREFYENVIWSCVQKKFENNEDAISHDDFYKMSCIQKEFNNHPIASKLFRRGGEEVKIEFEFEGLTFFAIIDYLRLVEDNGNQSYLIGELKTAQSCKERDVQRTIYDYSYYLQAFIYKHGIEKITGIPVNFSWTFLETQAPYNVHSFAPSLAWFELAEKKLRHLCNKFKECREKQEWHDYQKGIDVIHPPRWATWESEE